MSSANYLQKVTRTRLTGNYWGPLDPSLEDKCTATRWTPKLEISTHFFQKGLWTTRRMNGRTDGRTDGRTYYTDTQGIWTRGLRTHALHAITGRANDSQKATRSTRDTERQRYGRTYKIQWTLLGYKCIATRWTPKLEMNTSTKITKSHEDNWTDRNIIIPLRGLNLWLAAAYTVRNYGPREWSPKIESDDQT